MHELSIAQSLLEILEQEAKARGAAKVTRVKLRIGALSGVVREALEFAFEVASGGTVAEGASLEIEEVPVRIRCPRCGVLEQEGPFLVCPRCGEVGVLLSGRELEIDSMEIEDGGQGRQGHP